jgi:hypothetical protein
MPKKTEDVATEPQASQPQEQFAAPAQDAPIMRRGPRSQRAKLLGLVQGNRAFRGFKVDESWTDAQFASAVKDFMANSQVQPITQSGARLRAPERE